MMKKQQIENIAKHVEGIVCDMIFTPFYNKIDRSKRLMPLSYHLNQLKNRSNEYHNPSFVVLVVGPVKSGKSTFVNLVAKKYVSPTHFLECTVRPSLISNGKGNSLKVYRSSDPEKKEEQMNEILDCLNGLIDEKRISGINIETHEYSSDSVDMYIKTDEISIDQDDILLTSIQTEGGRLLQDNVFLVDMAGFDGNRAHMDNSPAYKTIIERADLIVFVQSSNSAISKVSGDFFSLLQKRNSSVPVCLVHNVFESAYWRQVERKLSDIEYQRQHAIDQIKKHKLSLDSQNAFNLNLGKVADLRDGKFVPENEESLRQEEICFEKAEAQMYKLFELREEIRLKNCVVRTKTQRDLTLDKVDEMLEEFAQKEAEYSKLSSEFDSLKKSPNSLQIPCDVNISVDELIQQVNIEYNSAKQSIANMPEDTEFSTNEAREKVLALVSKINERISDFIDNRSKELDKVQNCEEVVLWINSIHHLSSQYVPQKLLSINIHMIERSLEVDPDFNVNDYVKSRRSILHPFRNHHKDDMLGYYKIVRDTYCGVESDGIKAVGYIQDSLNKDVQRLLVECKSTIKDDIIKIINKNIDELKEAALYTILPDYDVFCAENDTLLALKKELENLNIHINSKNDNE